MFYKKNKKIWYWDKMIIIYRIINRYRLYLLSLFFFSQIVFFFSLFPLSFFSSFRVFFLFQPQSIRSSMCSIPHYRVLAVFFISFLFRSLLSFCFFSATNSFQYLVIRIFSGFLLSISIKVEWNAASTTNSLVAPKTFILLNP